MRVMTIVGARPQFIKAAVVSRAFNKQRPDDQEILVHTGQHYDANMSDVFFDELDIPKPDYNLGVGGGTHGQNTGRMLERLEALMMDCRPDWVLVYGDTDSTLAAALAASKLHIPVAHVEAGLRSFNRYMPEEINRILADHISDLLFAPCDAAYSNLIKENVPQKKIQLVGDVMYDAALFYKDKAKEPVVPKGLKIHGNDYVLCTVHRAENTDSVEKLSNIFLGLGAVDEVVILPMHPRTKLKVERGGLVIPSNIYVIDPVSYLEMVWLESMSRCVATDSGGVQKEAYFHGKPCITLREETEWNELVESGWNKIAGTDSHLIKKLILEASPPSTKENFYGLGNAGKLISEALKPSQGGES